MKAKKIPLYLLMFFAVLGASLTLGFLSFGGMFALVPILPLAIAAFFLSTAYEGEINLKNIQGALNKLLKRNHLKQHFANDYLVNYAAHCQGERRPEFFRDYEKQLKLLQKLKKDSKKDKSLKPHKKQAEKKLKDMEKWFAEQLFSKNQNPNQSAYVKELQAWLKAHGQEDYQARYKKRALLFHGFKVFSVFSGLFMTLGTSYLLGDAIAAIGFLGVLFANPVTGPILTVVAGILLISAGVAWALLTYNNMTDLINNRVAQNWWETLKEEYKNGSTAKKILLIFGAALMLTLAGLLTYFTGETWVTIGKTGKPFFSFLAKLPAFIMSGLNPAVISISVAAFNINNSYETFQEFNEAMTNDSETNQDKKPSFGDKIKDRYENLKKRENWIQRINPFRILLIITMSPLLFILFLGHLVSISVTADRVKDYNPIFTGFIGFLAEFFEDFHYFIPLGHHDHHHQSQKQSTQDLLNDRHKSSSEHDHDNNIPKQLIKFIFSPLYLLAITWDWAASKKNDAHSRDGQPKPLNFMEACKKHKLFIFDYKAFKKSLSKPATDLPDIQPLPRTYSKYQHTKAWRAEHAIDLIERHERKHMSNGFFGRDKLEGKKAKLQDLKDTIQKNPKRVEAAIAETANKKAIRAHRFLNSEEPTRTQQALFDISERIGAPTA